MKTNYLIVADLGLLRAYRVVQRPRDHQPHLELVDEMRLKSAHEKLSEQVTDKAGRFPRGSGAANVLGDLSAGERHNLDLEGRRRLIKMLAERINRLLRHEDAASCSFAVSGPVHLGSILSAGMLALLVRQHRCSFRCGLMNFDSCRHFVLGE